MNDDGWGEWRRFVLAELKNLNKASEEQGKKIDDLSVQFAELRAGFRARLGLWGFIGGLVPALLGAIVYLIIAVI